LLLSATVALSVAVGVASTTAAAHPPQRAAAGGGSLLYIKRGAIHLARANGRHDVVFKRGSWSWPSMDNHGVIAALAPDGRTAPDGSNGYSVYRFRQSGRRLSHVPTPVDFSTLNYPYYPPNHVALSPDGKKIAYDYVDAANDDTPSAWTPATRFRIHTFSNYTAPRWMGNGQLLISHLGVTLTNSQPELAVWTPTRKSAKGWTTKLADSWATSYNAVASRNGRKVALIEDNAADYIDGVPRRVALVFATASGPGHVPLTRRCSIKLPVRLYKRWYGTLNVGMSFRPDSNVLAWDAQNGIWAAKTRALASCSASSLHAHLWIRGGADPYFSPAADRR
jgi:hypothetical protein